MADASVHRRQDLEMGDLAAAEAALRAAALAMVQDERGVRVEDYLTSIAATVGEGALAAAGFDVTGHDLTPGSGLFYEPVNELLTGDSLDDVPAGSVYGILASLAPAPLPTPRELYEHVARSVGAADWGQVTVTVPEGNRPWVLPLRSAYDLRPVVAALEVEHALALDQRHVLTATALGSAITQVEGAIDPGVAVRLALEVTFGMAKMAPMTDAAMAGSTP
jgi:hypothetical protein